MARMRQFLSAAGPVKDAVSIWLAGGRPVQPCSHEAPAMTRRAVGKALSGFRLMSPSSAKRAFSCAESWDEI
jgi:hypothetical protein